MIFISAILQLLAEYFFDNKVKVLLKDDNFLVVNKRYDLRINSNDENKETVQTWLIRRFPSLARHDLCHNFYFVHRLDYATSGIMCIPLNKHSCKVTAKAFSERTTKKYYIAILRGLASQEMINVEKPIGEDVTQREIQKMCTIDNKYCILPRAARTIFLVLEYGFFNDYPATKVLIRPVTGRRHQIRVHSSSLGHHIVGDFTYSNRKDTLPSRMYLHAIRLVLPNPIDSLDIQTEDPFIMRDWISFKILNELKDGAFQKLDTFLLLDEINY